MSGRHVAVDVVTGFLGSGKTTLLRHVLAHGLRGKRVALVMNEIGEVGIDGPVVTGMRHVEKMVELSGGCICCSIDEYRFDLAVREIIDTVRPDVIVIESTGLADPDPLAYRVRDAGLRLDAVITLVDALNIERFLVETMVARAQIAAADFLVLNKTDLVADVDVARVEGRLRALNPRALRLHAVRGAVDSDVLFATGVAAYRERAAAASAESGHLASDAFGSFLYRGTRELDPVAFERFLERLPADVIRAKGVVRLAGREWHCLFNVTCGRSEIAWIRLPGDRREAQGVFIGRHLDRHRDTVLRALRRCEVLPPGDG